MFIDIQTNTRENTCTVVIMSTFYVRQSHKSNTKFVYGYECVLIETNQQETMYTNQTMANLWFNRKQVEWQSFT